MINKLQTAHSVKRHSRFQEENTTVETVAISSATSVQTTRCLSPPRPSLCESATLAMNCCCSVTQPTDEIVTPSPFGLACSHIAYILQRNVHDFSCLLVKVIWRVKSFEDPKKYGMRKLIFFCDVDEYC